MRHFQKHTVRSTNIPASLEDDIRKLSNQEEHQDEDKDKVRNSVIYFTCQFFFLQEGNAHDYRELKERMLIC